MPESFVTYEVEKVLVGETLPGGLYVYVDQRFITFRGVGDSVDRNAYDRLLLKGVRFLFIQEKDRAAFHRWSLSREPMPAAVTEDDRRLRDARDEVQKGMSAIFLDANPNKMVAQALEASKKLVTEVMNTPLAVRPLAQLQSLSQGTVEHSVSVAVLATYLGMQMGYSHAKILQHIAGGALLHDIGKTRIEIADSDSPEEIAHKMREHPERGAALLEGMGGVPNEVLMIVAQHHECQDGTGYPKKLRGNQIYDLARIVALANQFDELVMGGKGSLVERQRTAIAKLDQELSAKFDPQKLDKALKILKLGL